MTQYTIKYEHYPGRRHPYWAIAYEGEECVEVGKGTSFLDARIEVERKLKEPLSPVVLPHDEVIEI
jgi:hypothetical protein